MTIVVLLILVVVWAAVLGPSLWRRHFHRHSADSIGAFHRQLRVLQRTSPPLVAPIHRLDTSVPSAHVAEREPTKERPGLIVVRPDAALPVDLSAPAEPALSSSRRADPFFRPEACRRRRDVLLVLAVLVLVTGLLGVIALPALAVTALAAVALAGYVATLVRMRNRAAEREAKLRFLPDRVDTDLIATTRRVAAR